MKKYLLILFFSMPLFATAQEHHLGLRIGEPFSITYKTFIDERFSLEALAGSAGPNSTQYYRRTFENNRPFPAAMYGSHSTSNGLSLNARLAYNEDITSEFDISEGELFAYAGVGAQIRSVRVNYVYFDGGNPDVSIPLSGCFHSFK